MERHVPEFLLATQNVDGLHEAAGSTSLIELHGSLWRLRCPREAVVTENRQVPIEPLPPVCSCGATLRPDVVWFGEAPPSGAFDAALRCARRCEVMIVAGTSSLVHPAASLPHAARESGAWIVEVNPEPTPLTPYVDQPIQGRAANVLPDLFEAAFAQSAR